MLLQALQRIFAQTQLLLAAPRGQACWVHMIVLQMKQMHCC
jgi:hypothetical protein